MRNLDCVIVGYGPCGISAAIYLKRYGFDPVVIGKDGGALAKAEKIENYYGIPSISGKELMDQGIHQAKALGIEVIEDEVLSIEMEDNFTIVCKNNQFTSKAVFLALGVSRNKLSIASDFEGKGVSYCATCDGFFYRKKKTAIIGNSEYMLHELEVLKKMIPDITVFTDGKPLLVDVKDTKVVTEKLVSFQGDTHLESITTTKETYPIDGCFIAIGSASGFTLAKHLGLALKENYIKVDDSFMTNIPGIFAGGDCIGGLLQVSKAVSDGANAATAISKYLKGHKS